MSEWLNKWVSECKNERKRGGHKRANAYIRPRGGVYCTMPTKQTRRRPREARAYIRALGDVHCSTPATQTRRRSRDVSAYIQPLGDVYCPTLWYKKGGDQGTPERISVPLAVHINPRLPYKWGGNRGTPGRVSDPLAVRIVPRLSQARLRPRLSHGCASDLLCCPYCSTSPSQKKRRSRNASTFIRPLEMHSIHICNAKKAETKGRHSVYTTLW